MNWKIKIVLIVLSFTFTECENIKNKSKDGNDLLISYSNKFVMEDTDSATGFYTNHDEFIKPYFSVDYVGDTIKASTLHEINTCGKTVGKVKVVADTLFLLTENNSDEMCASVEFHKFTYLIKNPQKKKFIVKG